MPTLDELEMARRMLEDLRRPKSKLTGPELHFLMRVESRLELHLLASEDLATLQVIHGDKA